MGERKPLWTAGILKSDIVCLFQLIDLQDLESKAAPEYKFMFRKAILLMVIDYYRERLSHSVPIHF